MTAPDPLYASRALAKAAGLSGANTEQLLLGWKQQELVRGRWAVMICLQRRGASKGQIGRRINRDPATVWHGLKMARALLAQDPDFAALVAEVDAA